MKFMETNMYYCNVIFDTLHIVAYIAVCISMVVLILLGVFLFDRGRTPKDDVVLWYDWRYMVHSWCNVVHTLHQTRAYATAGSKSIGNFSGINLAVPCHVCIDWFIDWLLYRSGAYPHGGQWGDTAPIGKRLAPRWAPQESPTKKWKKKSWTEMV